MSEVQQFYDGIADNYQFIFVDWQQSVQRQSNIISDFLVDFNEAPPKTVLDCTCGIGTQAIGLALKGYHVHATDLSPKEIEHAQEYTRQFETPHPITFAVADLLQAPENPIEYDIVLAFDNPIAHFHTEEDLLTAFKTMALQLKQGGLLTTSLRDYDTLVGEKPKQSHISVTDGDNGRRIMFQVWDWLEDNSGYHSEMFILKQIDNQWQTDSYKSKMRAWQRDEVSAVLAQVGLSDIKWYLPDESGFYQPIVTARK